MASKKSPLSMVMAEAKALEGSDFTLPQPVHVISGEAVDVAKFAATYWAARRDPRTGQVVFPGLEMAGMPDKLPSTIAGEILQLREAFEEANTKYMLTVTPKEEQSPMARARFVLGEIAAALQWLFDDGVSDEKDARLAKVMGAHADDPDTMDAVASELVDYASLAEAYRSDLAGIEAFDVGLIDEAKELAAKLRERSPATRTASAEESEALELRNRVGTLLLRRMNVVRAAARLVFRHHPNVVREVTSAYERRRRSEARRAKKAEDDKTD